VSPSFNETIAHAIHSMTVQDLQLFDPEVTVNNHVPTVNRKLSEKEKVLSYAPNVPRGTHFRTEAFNMVDYVLSHANAGDDGLGKNWLLQERLVHAFHMRDLWFRILDVFKTIDDVPAETCECLMNTQSNGIHERLQWIANRYSVDTPISLHEWGTQIPKLLTAEQWPEWKKRFSYYYTAAGDMDPAIFLHCALNKK